MDSQTTTDSHTADIEVLKKMEDEHLRLQRQVRMIQTDRLHRIMGVHPQFRKQNQLLKTLRKEYINLIKDLKIARSGAHKKKDKLMKVDLKKAILLHMKTALQCDGGVTLMQELDEMLQRNNKHVLFLRKTITSHTGRVQERQYQSEKRLMSMENNLEAAMLRFNALQWENKNIREEIEHMLRDRALFNQEWSKMVIALSKGKKYLTDIFESSTVAYDQRDEWCAKLKSVQEKGKMDQMLQIQEMRDLQKAFDHDMKLCEFLARKGIIRINKRQEEREETKKKKEAEDIKKELDAHVKILDDINDYTEEKKVNVIIEDFERTEQENFSIYKLLTTCCAENEALSRHVKRIRQELEDRSDWNEMMETKRIEKLVNLRKNIEDKKIRNEELRKRLEEKEQALDGAMEGIKEVFKILDCSLEPFQNLLGDKQPSLHHLNLSLCLITDKIKEHIEAVYYYERHIQKKSKTSTSRLKKYTVHPEITHNWSANPITLVVPTDPCPTCVEARWLSRVSEAAEMPFNKQMALAALEELATDPAYERSDRIHPLIDCKLPRSRVILARRYL